MDIKQFVSSTIIQVMEAVTETQAVARGLGGYVNPTASVAPPNEARLGYTANGHAIYSISFDVAVTVGAESGTEGGGKLQVASIVSLGGKAKAADRQETVSRVQFMVPITLPVDTDSTEDRRARRIAADAQAEASGAAFKAARRR